MSRWYPFAVVHAGPAWKRYAGTNPNKGVVLHSAEGYKAGVHSELARSDRRAQWHFTVYMDGLVEQHHPLSAILAHAADWGSDNDGANANGELIAIEHEGVAGQPLTVKQREASVALVKWIAEQGGWEPSRTTNKTLWEHRELSDTGTSCPSDRIPWAYYTVRIAPVQKPPKLTALSGASTLVSALFMALTGGKDVSWANESVKYEGSTLGTNYRRHRWAVTWNEKVK